jgi:hypothetical protein
MFRKRGLTWGLLRLRLTGIWLLNVLIKLGIQCGQSIHNFMVIWGELRRLRVVQRIPSSRYLSRYSALGCMRAVPMLSETTLVTERFTSWAQRTWNGNRFRGATSSTAWHCSKICAGPETRRRGRDEGQGCAKSASSGFSQTASTPLTPSFRLLLYHTLYSTLFHRFTSILNMPVTTRKSSHKARPGVVHNEFMRERRTSAQVVKEKAKKTAVKAKKAQDKVTTAAKVADIEQNTASEMKKRKAEARAPPAVEPDNLVAHGEHAYTSRSSRRCTNTLSSVCRRQWEAVCCCARRGRGWLRHCRKETKASCAGQEDAGER